MLFRLKRFVECVPIDKEMVLLSHQVVTVASSNNFKETVVDNMEQ